MTGVTPFVFFAGFGFLVFTIYITLNLLSHLTTK